MNFEQGSKRLEEIITKLDSNDVLLEDSIKLFEEGVLVSKECLEILNGAKGKITQIKEQLDKLIEEKANFDE